MSLIDYIKFAANAPISNKIQIKMTEGLELTKDSAVKVLIIDRDGSIRDILYQALSEMESAKVVGQNSDYKSALPRINALKPDLILLEFEIPQAAIRNIVTEFRRIKSDIEIVLISEKYRTGAKSSLRALNLGALYIVRKPKENSPAESVQYFKKYLKPIITQLRIGRITAAVCKVSGEMTRQKPVRKLSPKHGPIKAFGQFNILAIGGSLGGIDALNTVIPRLPEDFPVPVVVVQHMPGGFTGMLSCNLDDKSRLIVVEARAGMKLRPGYVYVAPGGKHLEVSRLAGAENQYITSLNDGPLVKGCRPAVDVLFKSLATSINGNILAVVLSGMGADGLESVRLLKQKGNCFCITQDETTSVVYGMPGEIAAAGLSDVSLPINKIADCIVNMVGEKKYVKVS